MKRQRFVLILIFTLFVFGAVIDANPTTTMRTDNSLNTTINNDELQALNERTLSGSGMAAIGNYIFNMLIEPNNNTLYSNYAHMVTNFRYGAYWLDVSNQGDMFVYESHVETNMWYSESFQDLSWQDTYGGIDYISNNLGVSGVVNQSTMTYNNIATNTTFMFENTIMGVESNYIINQLPKDPATWMTSPISLSFGFNFKFSDSAIIFVGNTEWDKSSDMDTGEGIVFCHTYPDTQTPNWKETYGSFELPAPYAIDGAGAKIDGNYAIRKSGNRFFIYKNIPYTWLNDSARVFPVIIDPTTVDTSTDAAPLYGSNQIFTGPNYHTIAYNDGTGLMAARIDVGDTSTYSVSTVISSTDVDSASIVGYPNNDTIYCFWYEPSADDVHMKKSTDGGATWGSQKDITTTNGAENYFWYSPDLALNGDHAGRLGIAIRRFTGGLYYNIWVYYSDNEGDSWTLSIPRSDTGTEGANPESLCWVTGDIWLLGVRPWEGSEDDKWIIYRSTNGMSSWTKQFVGSAVTGQDVDNMQIMAPWKNTTDRSNIVFAGMWRYGDIDDYTFGMSWDYGQTWMESQRNDQTYPDDYIGISSFVVDGGVEGYDSHYVISKDDDSVSSTDDLQIAQRGAENWASTLSWSVWVSSGEMMNNRMSVSRVTNQDGYYGAVWVEGTSSPYDIVVYESTLTALNTTTAWLDGWNRRKAITLGGITDAGPNYQVLLDIEYGTGTDTGNTIYMNTYGQTDFDDVRFTDNDGDTLLDYYIEEYTASGDASFWVEVHDALDEDVVIYMYYENSTVSDVSNGENTFIFFDDFENGNLNRWTTVGDNWAASATYYKRGSYGAYADADSVGRNLEYQQTYPTKPSHYESLYDSVYQHVWFRSWDVTGHLYPIVDYEADADIIYVAYQATNDYATYDGTSTLHYYSNAFVTGTWYELGVALDFESSLFRSWLDGTARATFALKSAAGVTVTDMSKFCSVSSSTVNDDQAIDDYWVRSYVYDASGEPTVSSVAAVEQDNYAPVNDQAPTCAELDDTDNLYATYKYYSIIVYVSDVDGYADISYLDLYGYSNDRGTNWWILRYTEDTDTFSEQSDDSDYVSMSGSSASKSGNDIDATFEVKVDWTHPDATDIDLRVVVYDSLYNDDDYYEVDWDVETRLDYSVVPAVTGDDSGTIDRGDLDEAFTIEGTVKYYGSSLVPPDAEYDVWASSGEYGTTVGPFSDLSPVSGAFSVTCYADDVFGIDTWTIKPVEAGTGSGGTSLYYTTDLTDTYISDQVKVSGYTDSVTGDYNIGRMTVYATNYEYIYATLVYAYDSAQVTTGSFTIQGKTATHTGSGVWRITEQYFSSCNVTYDTVAGSDTTHGITTVDQNGQETWMVYTRLISSAVWSSEADNRTYLHNDVWMYWQVTVEYTGELMTGTDNPTSTPSLSYTYSGDFLGFSLQYSTDTNGDGTWERYTGSTPYPWNHASVKLYLVGQGYSPSTYAGSFSPNKYDLDPYVYRVDNPYYFIYDQIHVTAYASNFTKCDLNTNVGVNVTLKYDYDETPVTDEDVWADGYHFTHIENGIYGIDTGLSYGTVTAYTFDMIQIPTYNNTWGLTGYYAISQNGKSITIIWDTITVTMTANMTWSYIGYNVQITATATYTYDGTSSDATVTINSTLSSPHVATFATVGLRSYTATGISGDSNGITGWSTDSVSVIWDKMVVPSYSYYWTQQDIWNVWLQVTSNVWVFEYDNDPMSTYTDSGSSSDIRFYTNGTNNEYSSLDEVGNLPTTGVGPFTPSWYYANISLYWQSTCQGRTYNLYVTHFVVEVQILHSIHIEDSGIDVQDDWITFVFHTNWDNASFTIWDNITGTPALVGYSKDEGWYQIAKPTVVGAHKYIVLINGTHDGTDSTGQIATGSDGDSWKYRYFTLTVNPTTLSLTNILSTADSAHISLTVTASTSGNYYVYDNGTYQSKTASFTAGIVTVTWAKLSTVGLHIWGVHFNDSSTSLWINGSYDVAATVLAITETIYTNSDSLNRLSGETNLGVTWTAYDNDSLITSGSLSAGSFSIPWARQTAKGLHNWGAKFTDGTTIIWKNGSYESSGLLILQIFPGQDNDSIYISGQIYSTDLSLNYWIWEDSGSGNVLVGSGAISLAATTAWFSIEWDKSAENVEANWTLTITDGSNNSTAYGWYTELDSAVTNITNNASYLQDNSVENNEIIQGDVYDGPSPEASMWQSFGYIAIVFGSVFLVGSSYYYARWRATRRRKQDRGNDWLTQRR